MGGRMRPALMTGFLLVFGWMTFAETVPLNAKADISCYKNKELIFKLKTGSVKAFVLSNVFENVIEGNVQTSTGTISLASAFPYLEIESNASMIMVEPTVCNPITGLIIESPLDLEATIDLATHLGRISVVANSAQAVVCASCVDAIDVECSN
jgi:hypothetical protein